MTFHQLQENLRRVLWQRIEAGLLTGLKLAHDTGFQQAHISNFLNRKRGLSLEGMDKVLASEKISVLDLLDPAEINKRASIPPPAEEGFENIFLVDAETAANDALVTSEKVRDVIKLKRASLKRLKPEMQTPRESWTRFLAIRLGPDAISMYPRLLPHATVLIDRYCNSVKAAHRGERRIYAIRKDRKCLVSYVEVAGRNLILRPHNQACNVDLLPVEEGKSLGDYIVGRVCYMFTEI